MRTRRAFVVELGKASLAVAVLGTACSRRPAGEPANRDGSATTQWERVDMGFVSAYLLYRGGAAALVDTGQAGAVADVEAALASIGLGWDSLAHVIVTHRHPDHAGGAEEIASLAPGAEFHIGAGDIDGLRDIEGAASVGDGDRVFELEIIDTPGHTAGHISVLDGSAGILVAGDALSNDSGVLGGSNPQFTADPEQADDSVVILAGFEYETLLVGHGEPITSGASTAVARLADEL